MGKTEVVPVEEGGSQILVVFGIRHVVFCFVDVVVFQDISSG